MSDALMTMTGYAESRGLDKSTISKQVAAGLIPVVHIPGRKWVKIDPAAADDARAKNLDIAKRTRGNPVIPASNAVEKQEPAPAALPLEEPAPEQATLPSSANPAYIDAKAASIALDVQKKQIDLMRQRGELVLKKTVDEGAEKAARMVRDKVLASVDELAELVFSAENLNAARVKLRAGLKSALTELADTLQQTDFAPTENAAA